MPSEPATEPDVAPQLPASPANAPEAAPPTPMAGAAAGAGAVSRLAVIAALSAAVATFLYWYGNKHDFFDLKIYIRAMRWWADGNELYEYVQPDRVQGTLYFTYPPFAALLLRPLALVSLDGWSFRLAVAVFTVGTALAVAVTTWWLVGPLADARRWPRWFAAGLAIPLVFLIEPTRETITFGQINMLLIVLVLADLLFAVPGGRRLAGVGIGVATALKLFPGIFIVYLLVTRRWRAAAVASATAAGATLLAAAVAPQASWRFWTEAMWSTERVGRTDYTGNQSLQGMLARLTAPDQPPRWVWLVLVIVVAVAGLWRAARAARAGDDLAGLTLTGLVAALVSPITWPHHVFWFVPALVVLAGAVSARHTPAAPASAPPDAAPPDTAPPDTAPPDTAPPDAAPIGPGRRVTLAVLGVSVYAVTVFGVVSFIDFGTASTPTDTVGTFLLRNAYVLMALALLATLPVYTRLPAK